MVPDLGDISTEESPSDIEDQLTGARSVLRQNKAAEEANRERAPLYAPGTLLDSNEGQAVYHRTDGEGDYEVSYPNWSKDPQRRFAVTPSRLWLPKGNKTSAGKNHGTSTHTNRRVGFTRRRDSISPERTETKEERKHERTPLQRRVVQMNAPAANQRAR